MGIWEVGISWNHQCTQHLCMSGCVAPLDHTHLYKMRWSLACIPCASCMAFVKIEFCVFATGMYTTRADTRLFHVPMIQGCSRTHRATLLAVFICLLHTATSQLAPAGEDMYCYTPWVLSPCSGCGCMNTRPLLPLHVQPAKQMRSKHVQRHLPASMWPIPTHEAMPWQE